MAFSLAETEAYFEKLLKELKRHIKDSDAAKDTLESVISTWRVIQCQRDEDVKENYQRRHRPRSYSGGGESDC